MCTLGMLHVSARLLLLCQGLLRQGSGTAGRARLTEWRHACYGRDFFCETCPDGTGSFTVCACCGNFGASRPCTQCNAAYYCDKQCQKRHKKLHRKQCSGGGGGGSGSLGSGGGEPSGAPRQAEARPEKPWFDMPSEDLVTMFLGYIFQMHAIDYLGHDLPLVEEERYIQERLSLAKASRLHYSSLAVIQSLREWAKGRAYSNVSTDDLVFFHDKFVDALIPFGMPIRANGQCNKGDKEYAPYISRWVMTLIDNRPNMVTQMSRCPELLQSRYEDSKTS